MNQLAGIITEGQANKMMAILKEDDMSTDTTLSPEKQLLLKTQFLKVMNMMAFLGMVY
jgi:hypothetical protein